MPSTQPDKPHHQHPHAYPDPSVRRRHANALPCDNSSTVASTSCAVCSDLTLSNQALQPSMGN
eukprot:10419373-Prorocentrum_lima.AAC.1